MVGGTLVIVNMMDFETICKKVISLAFSYGESLLIHIFFHSCLLHLLSYPQSLLHRRTISRNPSSVMLSEADLSYCSPSNGTNEQQRPRARDDGTDWEDLDLRPWKNEWRLIAWLGREGANEKGCFCCAESAGVE